MSAGGFLENGIESVLLQHLHSGTGILDEKVFNSRAAAKASTFPKPMSPPSLAVLASY